MTAGKAKLLSWFALAASAALGFIFGFQQKSNHSVDHAKGSVWSRPKEQETKRPRSYQAESTRRMALLLKELGKNFPHEMLVFRQDSTLARYAHTIIQP